MLKRDYLIKQFEEFGKVMAVLLGLKRDGKYIELENLIRSTALKYTSFEIAFVEQLDDINLLKTLTEEKQLTDEQLKMVADLLFEKAELQSRQGREQETMNCYRKAQAIYTFIQANATLPYSLDVHYKLNFLKQFFSGLA